ncbi:MAG: sugar ABC transporter ATP-binding protein [Actinomycetes bacterium]
MVASAKLVSSPMQPFLQVVEISKMFPGVQALDAVNVDIFPGEVHCWIGENGAGKSTLVKILAGSMTPSSGQIRISDEIQDISSPHHAQQLGLSFIFQELSVVNGLSVADNILLGNELSRGPLVLPKASFVRAKELLMRIGFGSLDPNRKVGQLSTAEKQAVMVARALNIDAKVIFMDETTSTLDRDEVENLFSVIRTLKSEGRSIVFISHRLNEVEKIADRITIFKDGGIVGTYNSGELSINGMIRKMVGRDIEHTFPTKNRTFGKSVLEVKNISTAKISDVNLAFQSGKITGIAGLVGSGRTELMSALFGLDRLTAGSISMGGELQRFRNCRDAIRVGIGLVPEDRRGQGIIGLRSVEENISITWAIGKPLRSWKRDSVVLAKKFISGLSIKTPSMGKQVGQLSGGNQQKCVVARWLAVAPGILLLDEPTRGIDVGAKAEMYQIIDQLAREGMAVVIVSSDLPELLGLADEIAVMREGLFMGMLGGDSSEEEVMSLAMGEVK